MALGDGYHPSQDYVDAYVVVFGSCLNQRKTYSADELLARFNSQSKCPQEILAFPMIARVWLIQRLHQDAVNNVFSSH